MNLEFSVGRFRLHVCFGEDETLELRSETKLVGFQPNDDEEDDDE